MSTVATRVTVDQLDALPLPPGCEYWELERGEPIAVGDGTRMHEYVRERLNYLIRRYLDEHPVGECYTELGIRFDQHNRRRPDISFFTKQRVEAIAFDQIFTIAPDLAIEIVSISETAAYLNQKILHLRREGTTTFWLIYLQHRSASIRSGETIRDFTDEDFLEAPDLLPGFRVSIRSLFPAPGQ